jgi:predicted ATPase
VTLLQSTGPAIVFGRYRLMHDPLRLTADGKPVAVGARALTLLSALVQAGGRPVSFAELASRIWGRPNVEINSVQVQVSALRRALGEDRDMVATMAGHGYRFVGLDQAPEAGGAVPAGSEPAPAHSCGAARDLVPPCATRMPLHATPFVGRYAELSELLGLMSTARVMTLVGAPGVGKTRLAHEVARRVAKHFPDSIGAVTLSPQLPADGLVRTLARAIGIMPEIGSVTLERFGAAIGVRRWLLIVDCCEPLRGALGDVLGKLVTMAPALRVIVTAAQPLSIAREQIVAVGPLNTPDHVDIEAAEALTFDAFRLLFARLALLLDADPRRTRRPASTDIDLSARFDFGRLSSDTVAKAAAITRRLGGAPLALELAASVIARRMRNRIPLHVALCAFVAELSERMSRIVGRADIPLAPPAAIAAILDIHNDEFDVDTRAQLRRLGIFSGEFTRRAAIGMLSQFSSSPGIREPEQAQTDARCETCLDVLLDAGLVEQIEEAGGTVLRLQGAVRLFAVDALGRTNELGRAAAAQARSLAARLSTESTRRAGSLGDAGAHVELELDALRAALKWSMLNDRFEIAAALIEASAPLWRQLSLLHEYVRTIRGVLTRMDASGLRRPREEMRLCKALASALALTQAPRQEIEAAWSMVYDLAGVCADNAHRELALAGLVACVPDAWEPNRAWGAMPLQEGIVPCLKADDHVEA